MADRPIRMAPRAPAVEGVLVASGAPLVASGDGYAGTALVTQGSYDLGARQQAWGYYETIGPLNYAVNWRAQVLSRISLTIGEMIPGERDPIQVDTGAAVEILQQLSWDEGQILSDLSVQLDVPGRGYLVGRDVGGVREWCVYSSDQVRPTSASRSRALQDLPVVPQYEIQEVPGARWEPLTGDTLVTLVRNSDKRWHWRDTSNVRAALVILREIDLYNREIVSTLVSRIANNGLLLIPQEMSFPARKQQNDAQDPFMLELIEAARQSLKDPGSASAAIPMPLRVPSQFIDKFVHLKLGDVVDSAVLTARQDAYSRLADTINLPREIVTGISDVNHSAGLSQDLEDTAIKAHIAPTAELICRPLTTGFLYPQLLANQQPLTGPSGGRLVVWYDMTAITIQPDKSGRSVELYDRIELSGEAMRRENGFAEDDAPDEKETREQILKIAAKNAQLALTAIAELTGITGGRSNTSTAPVSAPASNPSDSVGTAGDSAGAPPQGAPADTSVGAQ